MPDATYMRREALEQRGDQALAAEEIAGILVPEGSQSFVGVARF
jgi:hypothetical protein